MGALMAAVLSARKQQARRRVRAAAFARLETADGPGPRVKVAAEFLAYAVRHSPAGAATAAADSAVRQLMSAAEQLLATTEKGTAP